MGYLVFGTYHDERFRENVLQQINTVKKMNTAVNKSLIATQSS